MDHRILSSRELAPRSGTNVPIRDAAQTSRSGRKLSPTALTETQGRGVFAVEVHLPLLDSAEFASIGNCKLPSLREGAQLPP